MRRQYRGIERFRGRRGGERSGQVECVGGIERRRRVPGSGEGLGKEGENSGHVDDIIFEARAMALFSVKVSGEKTCWFAVASRSW